MSVTAADHIASFLVGSRRRRGLRSVRPHQHLPAGGASSAPGAPRFVTTRHEQVAAHAADGYARASGKPGVVLLHVGPGMTNAVTGVATASFDSVPLLVIAGDVPSYYEGRGPAPGGQPPSRRGPGLDLRAVREAGVARPARRPAAADPGPRLGSRRSPVGRVPCSCPSRWTSSARSWMRRSGRPRRSSGRRCPRATADGDRDRAPHRPATAPARRRRHAPRDAPRSPGWRRRWACRSRTRSWAPASCRRTIRSSSGSSGSGGRRRRTGWPPRPT